MFDVLDTLIMFLKLFGLENVIKKSIIELNPFHVMIDSMIFFGVDLYDFYITYISTYAFLMALGAFGLMAKLLLNPDQMLSRDHGVGFGIGVNGSGNMFPGSRGFATNKIFPSLNGALPNVGGTIFEWLLNCMFKPFFYLTIAFCVSIASQALALDAIDDVIIAFVNSPSTTITLVLFSAEWFSFWIIVHMILVVVGLFAIPFIEMGNQFNSSLAKTAGELFDKNLYVPFFMMLLWRCGMMLYASDGSLAGAIGMGLIILGGAVPLFVYFGAIMGALLQILFYLLLLALAFFGVPTEPLMAVKTAGGITAATTQMVTKNMTKRIDGRKRPEINYSPAGGGL